MKKGFIVDLAGKRAFSLARGQCWVFSLRLGASSSSWQCIVSCGRVFSSSKSCGLLLGAFSIVAVCFPLKLNHSPPKTWLFFAGAWTFNCDPCWSIFLWLRAKRSNKKDSMPTSPKNFFKFKDETSKLKVPS